MCLVERRHGLSHVLIVGKFSIAWLKISIKKLVHLPEDTEFVDSSREGNRAFIAQKGFDKAGRYLKAAEYVVGGRRGHIVVPEG